MTARPSEQVSAPAAAALRRGLVAPRAAAGLIGLGAIAGLLPEGLLAPLLLALLVGLPHGGVDHVAVMGRVRGRLGVVLGTVGYLLAAALTFLAMRAVPLPAWGLFLLLSVWHFGTADREYHALRGTRASWLFALAAGAIPVAGLMVRDPEVLRPLAVAIDPVVARLLAPEVVSATALGLALLVLVALAVEVRGGRTEPARDLLVLSALVLVVPPLWAFGAYFGLWHAVRHVARMVATEAPWAGVMAARGSQAAWRRFARDAAGPTTIAAAALVALAILGQRFEAAALTAVTLQVTAAVTFPHVATVAMLDRRRATDDGAARSVVSLASAPRDRVPPGP